MTQSRKDLAVRMLLETDELTRGFKKAEASAKVFERELDRIEAKQRREQREQAAAVAHVARLRTQYERQASREAAAAVDAGAKKQVTAFQRVGAAASSMRTGVGIAAAAGGAAVVAMARKSIDAASGLNEQVAATETLFRDAADAVLDFGDSAAAIGLSERAALQAANAYGDMFVKLGWTHDAAAVFSEDLVRMAADFASFKDLDPGDVLVKLKAGLAGESEPLRTLGVFLNAAAVEAEAMRLGLSGANDELTEGEKVTARYSLIMAGMGDAYGDVARTADSYANTQRRATAEMENLRAEAGQRLLPIFTDLAYLAGEAAGSISDLSSASGDAADSGSMLGDAAEFFLGTLKNSTDYLGGLADGVRGLTGETDDAASATEYLADSQHILANAQDYTTEQVEQATQAIEAQEKALDQLLQATIAQFDSEMAYTLAVLGVSDAITKYDEALKKNRDGKDDNDLSANELRETELGLSQALLAAGDAAVKQAEDHAAAAGRVLSESEKYVIFRDALVKLKEQFPQLAGQIDGYVQRLENVPPEVRTDVGLDGVGEAMEQLGALDVLMDQMSGRNVTARVNTIRTTRELFLPGGLSANANGSITNQTPPGYWQDVPSYAAGGFQEDHTAQIAPAGAWRLWAEPETGGEAYIPLAPSKRVRSVSIWEETGRRLGMLGGAVTNGRGAGWKPGLPPMNPRLQLALAMSRALTAGRDAGGPVLTGFTRTEETTP